MKNISILFSVLALMTAHESAFAAGSQIQTLLLTSGAVDLANSTITLPLHHGTLKDGREVWFVLTDVSDSSLAESLGLVYAPPLASAAGTAGTRTATVGSNGEFIFSAGSVDFSPRATLVAGAAPNYFPPTTAVPGSTADADYSPFVQVDGGAVYNAPVLAFGVSADAISYCDGNPNYDLVHDKVVAICPKTQQVTLKLSHGFSDSHPIVYLSFDSNVTLAATMEASTYAPAEAALKGAGVSISLFAVTNGETGAANPNRQGFDSALAGDGSPLNVLTIKAGTTRYSPLWDLHIASWTDAAIDSQQRKVLTSAGDFSTAVTAGELTDVSGATTLQSSGILVNCPVVAILSN